MVTWYRQVFFTALLFGAVQFAHADDKCDVCGSALSGRYLAVGSRQYCGKRCYTESLPRCATCGGVIQGTVLQAGGRFYCSEACHHQSLPQCATCGQRIEGTHQTLDGKHYCGAKCLEKALGKCEICGTPLYRALLIGDHRFCESCARLPSCWRCSLPAPGAIALSDGRLICKRCSGDMITTVAGARSIYDVARREVRRVTSYLSPTMPNLHVVGRPRLAELAPGNAGLDAVQWGIYRRETTVTTTKPLFGKPHEAVTRVEEDIFILTGLDNEQFLSTACHELTHDLIAEQFPKIAEEAPDWVEEGLCQYVAAAVCLLNGHFDELNRIESAKDPEYGDGYRFFKNAFGDTDWEEAVEWMQKVSIKDLPQTPPK